MAHPIHRAFDGMPPRSCNMFYLRTAGTLSVLTGDTIDNVSMSTHRLANQGTQHRSTRVPTSILMPTDVDPFRFLFEEPLSLLHRTVSCVVLLLRVTYEAVDTVIPIMCLVYIPSGKVQ
jgi:hypothetical protein